MQHINRIALWLMVMGLVVGVPQGAQLNLRTNWSLPCT